jgi:hypothetical protein
MTKGRHFTPEELKRMVVLLQETDMSLEEIACRMRCSPGSIARVNRKVQVRQYGGGRNRWETNPGFEAGTERHNT